MPRLAPKGRALQYRDIPRAGQTQLREHMEENGRSLPEKVDSEITRLTGSTTNKKAERRVEALTKVQPHVVSKPITLDSAAKSREGLYDRAVQSTDGHGAPKGAGWYFDHHADIAASIPKTKDGQQHFTTDQAVTASAVMSPQNSPDFEKKAVTALMDAHAGGHTVTMSPAVAKAVGDASGAPVPAHQIGKKVKVADLAPAHLAHLSNPQISQHVEHSGVDFSGIAKGGVKDNVTKAIEVLRGHQDTATAIDPLSSPKVHTYRGNILKAVPNSPEHVEYMTRVGHHADVARGVQHEGQGVLDLYGLRHSDSGLLDHKGPTTEDTWQQAITTGQSLKTVGRANVAKTVGPLADVSTTGGRGQRIHPDPEVGTAALQHAYNNEATIRGAARVSKQHDLGFKIPAVAVQEVAWTQSRIEADKDPEHAKAVRRSASEAKAASALSGAQFKSLHTDTLPGVK